MSWFDIKYGQQCPSSRGMKNKMKSLTNLNMVTEIKQFLAKYAVTIDTQGMKF
jgi:hypothetical protein